MIAFFKLMFHLFHYIINILSLIKCDNLRGFKKYKVVCCLFDFDITGKVITSQNSAILNYTHSSWKLIVDVN